MRNNIEKNFSTSYEMPDDNGGVQVTQEKFRTKEENDSFAQGLELMGVGNIIKSYYDPLIRRWLPYSEFIEYTQNI